LQTGFAVEFENDFWFLLNMVVNSEPSNGFGLNMIRLIPSFIVSGSADLIRHVLDLNIVSFVVYIHYLDKP